MPFHQHYASWLYLAHGRKLWWLAPPEVSPAPALLWNDPWDTLRGWAHELEDNTATFATGTLASGSSHFDFLCLPDG